MIQGQRFSLSFPDSQLVEERILLVLGVLKMEEKAMGVKVMIGPGEGVSGLLTPRQKKP